MRILNFLLNFDEKSDMIKTRKGSDIMADKHAEYRRIVDDAEVAVLFIHGIIGTPNHFRELIPLVPHNYSIIAMVTDGHCGTVSDFSHSSLKRWEQSVQKNVDELLASHKKLYIVGHSMGTLFAIEQAMKEERIPKLFCISVPIKVGFRLRMIPMAYKIYTKKIKDDDTVTLALRECYGCTDDKNIFKYLGWVPRFFDLFYLIGKIRGELGNLKTPCVAFQSVPDELVSPKSIDILKKESNMRVEVLNNSTHFYYDEDEMNFLKEEFIEFLK